MSDDHITESVAAMKESIAVSGQREPLVVAAPGDPMAVARQFVEARFTDAGGAELLRNHRGDFSAWSGTCWPEAEERKIKADLYRWLEQASYRKKDSYELVPFEPTRYKVANVLEALRAVVHLDAGIAAPAWLDARTEPSAKDVVALANGLLDMPNRKLFAHTPAFFSAHALPFDYDPDAATPTRWLRFLDELWGDDEESIQALGEFMGYILSGDTRQQKMFLAVGPRRSGKGTIGRVLTGLLGAHNTEGPTLSGLTTNFGLSSLVGKPLAIISDARLGTRVDSMVAVERLLSISGEDTLTVDRKYRDPWTGRLPTRFLILTNEIPKFTDSSGALASRFVLFVFTESFYQREDPTLTDQLLAEAPGIFNWALEGLDRLLERGHFVQPRSAREALRHLEDLSSPVGAFVRDLCVTGPSFEVEKDLLFAQWKIWCEDEGRARPGTKAMFVRDLRAAVPGLKPVRARNGDSRRRLLQGIDLAEVGFSANNGPDPGPPRPTPDQDQPDNGLGRGPGQDPGAEKWLNHAGGSRWAGVERTVDASLTNGGRDWRTRDGVWHSPDEQPAFPGEVVETRTRPTPNQSEEEQ